SELKPGPRLELSADLADVCLSADNRVLALVYENQSTIRLVRADTLAPLMSLKPDRHVAAADAGELQVMALVEGAGGWFVLLGAEDGDGESGAYLTRYDRQGRSIRSWRLGSEWTISPKGDTIYVARDSDFLVVNTADGSARTIPFSWRRPLPRQYLP